MIIDFDGRGRINRLMDERDAAVRSKPIGGSAVVPSSYNLTQELTIEKFFLGGNPPTTQDLFMFLTRYEDHLRKERAGTLYIAKFINLDYLSVLETEIKRHRRGRFREEYATLGERCRILEGGKQLLSNAVLTDVIT